MDTIDPATKISDVRRIPLTRQPTAAAAAIVQRVVHADAEVPAAQFQSSI